MSRDGSRFSEPRPDLPGWDWEQGDYSWLSSRSGTHRDETSIFFIHGGRVRHQAHIPYGRYAIAEFYSMLLSHAEPLEEAHLVWAEDTGNGDSGLWVEGTRMPNEEDLDRLRAARRISEDRCSTCGQIVDQLSAVVEGETP